MVRHGDRVKAYKAAYPKATDESARVKSYTLLQNVTISNFIKEEADKIRSIATQEAITELKEEIKAEVLSAAQKREFLLKIVIGEYKNEVKKPVFNPATKKFEIVTVHEPSGDIARMKAIDLDNKMAGDYAPDKAQVDHTVNTPFSDTQVDKILQTLRETL